MDSAGAISDRSEYWPDGEIVSRTGTNPTPLTFLGVIGYFQDVLSKLFYVRARQLRVDLARWLTVDPLWPEQPSYTYADNAPVDAVDPSGTFAWLLVIGCGIACGVCVACMSGTCGYCGSDIQCWINCMENAPWWVQLACSAGCVACIPCLVLALAAIAATVVVQKLLHQVLLLLLTAVCAAICTAFCPPLDSQCKLQCFYKCNDLLL